MSGLKSAMSEPSDLTLRQMYRALFFPVYLPSFLMSVCLSSIMLVIPLFALELGAGLSVTSMVFALTGLGNMAVVVPAGYLTSRLGDRTIMTTGVGLVAVTAFAASFATSALHLSIAAFILGGALALWMLARLTYLSAGVPLHMRGKATATMAGLARVGFFLGPIVSGFIALRFGFSVVFLCVGLLALVTLAIVLTSIKINRKSGNTNAPSLIKLVPHTLARHWRTFLSAGSSVFCLTLMRSCRALLMPLWGTHIGLDSAQIGLVVGAAAAVDMMLFPVAGYIMDHWGRRYAAMSCQLMLALGLLLIPLSSGFWSMMVLAMIAGFGNGLGSGINMTLAADYAPDAERSEFLGVWRLVSDTGAFVGPMLAGYVAGALTLGGAFIATSSLGVIGSLIMIFFVKETLVKRRV